MNLTEAGASVLIETCIKASLNFWEVADDWDVGFNFRLSDEEEVEDEPREIACAECVILENYKRVRITFDLSQIESLELLWQVTAHEVCHIVTAEFKVFHMVVETSEITDVVWDFACERTTTQLERVFLREHPYEKVTDA